jgi:hypothetical protein
MRMVTKKFATQFQQSLTTKVDAMLTTIAALMRTRAASRQTMQMD